MDTYKKAKLEDIVANQKLQVTKLPLFRLAQPHHLLVECNNIQVDYPQDVCIHQLFEAQVERTPDAVAVVFEDTTLIALTYRELNARANQVAHHLQALLVKPEVFVGLCVERSIEMVVGMLGILKAGGAYVPLDPTYPLERLKFILSDSQAPVLLTQEKLVAGLPESGAHVVCLDTDLEVISRQSEANVVSYVTPDNSMYVIYTSGSTGQPKGVMIPHRGICNQLKWRQKTFGLTAVDKVLQTISMSFDPSVWQIFWALSFGAQLIIPRPGGHQDTNYLVKIITLQQITVTATVPSVLRVLLLEKGLENCRSLRHVTCGGEALSVELVDRFYARLKKENVLHNCYGPTEASIDTTFWTCERGSDRIFAPIGDAIANAEIYILDEDLQLVPVGEPGELHIGGVGLARGYLKRPDLSAEKFIPSPFPRSKTGGERLYKTGDLVRYLPDGKIEFLGRIDHAVKIRGFRIELGEIEAAIAQHPNVRETVVVKTEDVSGDQHLVAYVVPTQTLTSGELRHILQQKLPDYMIPSRFVFLKNLPLTPNGKVNRHALKRHDLPRQELEVTFVAPRDVLEQKLTEIWEQVLGVQPIGINDNFFELGGHSLLAVKLFWQIDQAFGRNLSLATLFPSGTVADLAEIIRSGEHLAPVTHASLVAIQPNGSKPPFFCIHPLEGNVLTYYDLAHYLDADQPFYGIQARGLDGQQSAYTRIEDMASDYIKEIQTLQPKGPYFLGGHSFGGIVAFEMAQQLHTQGEKVAILVLLDTRGPSAESRLPFRQRVPLHLKNLLQTGPAYIEKKFKQWISYLQYVLQYQIQKIAYQFYRRAQGCLPRSVRRVFVREAHLQALEKYTLHAYPGRVTLFGVEEQMRVEGEGYKLDPNFGWTDLAAEGLEVHYIPGDHSSMLKQPHVKVVGEKLQACLNLAQASIP